MRIIITGGSGLIGRALAERLAGKGHEVHILSRNPDRVKGLVSGTVVEGWDGRTPQGWGPLVNNDSASGGTAVVNLAGESIASGRWRESRKRRLRESRLDSTRAVVEAVRKASDPPKVLLQGSAVGYYGPRQGGEVTEESPPGEDFLARLAVAWEQASEPVEALGVRRVLLRTGVVLAESGGALQKMALSFRFFAGGRVGDGKQVMSWIHLEDEVKAICFLLESPQAAGPFNLTAPQPVTNQEMTQALAERLGRPAFMAVPAFALKLALGEMSTIVLKGQRALPRRLQEEGFEFRYPVLESALADLLS